MKKTACFAIGMLLAIGCGGETEDSTQGLTLDVTDTLVTGSYVTEVGELTFTAEEVSDGVVDVVIELNGLTLTGVVDRTNMVSTIDGFASDNGEATHIVDADREILTPFVRELADAVDIDAHLAADTLYRLTSHWSQTPDAMPLQRLVAGEADRGWTSICGAFLTWQWAIHDCNQCGNWQEGCTHPAYIGYHWDDQTHYYIGGQWTTGEPNYHPGSNVYEAGSCFGNCGGGCPGGDQTLTWDCTDHDDCVRNDHVNYSGWCLDELTAATDDEFFAPRCAGTSTD